jgi:hypothetical protein
MSAGHPAMSSLVEHIYTLDDRMSKSIIRDYTNIPFAQELTLGHTQEYMWRLWIAFGGSNATQLRSFFLKKTGELLVYSKLVKGINCGGSAAAEQLKTNNLSNLSIAPSTSSVLRGY